MLTQIRKIFSGVLGFALIGLLVIAFAAWGVADMFDMVGRGSVAKVGNQKIPTNEYRFRLAQQMDQISRELNEPLTIEQARTFGVDQQVLGRINREIPVRPVMVIPTLCGHDSWNYKTDCRGNCRSRYFVFYIPANHFVKSHDSETDPHGKRIE